MLNDKQDVFSIWENLKAEKKLAEEKGLNNVIKKEVLIIDGFNTYFVILCYPDAQSTAFIQVVYQGF